MVLDEHGHVAYEGPSEETLTKSSIPSSISTAETLKDFHSKAETDSGGPNIPANTTKSLNQIGIKDSIESDTFRQTGDRTVYTYYLKSAGVQAPLIFIFSILVYAFCDSFANSLWLEWWADANMEHPNSDLGKWLGVYAALGVGSFLGGVIGIYQIFIVVITKSGLYFHSMLLEVVSHAPMSLFMAVDGGVTLNRFSQDLQLIDMELPAAALGFSFGRNHVPQRHLSID